MRAEPKWAAAEWGKKLANLEPLQNSASVEQLGKAAKDAIRFGPTKRNRKQFLVCLAFSYLYERDRRPPTQRETLDYINENSDEKPLALSSLQTEAKYLGIKFADATYSRSQKRLDKKLADLVKALLK
jgi:hypothetical protein